VRTRAASPSASLVDAPHVSAPRKRMRIAAAEDEDGVEDSVVVDAAPSESVFAPGDRVYVSIDDPEVWGQRDDCVAIIRRVDHAAKVAIIGFLWSFRDITEHPNVAVRIMASKLRALGVSESTYVPAPWSHTEKADYDTLRKIPKHELDRLDAQIQAYWTYNPNTNKLYKGGRIMAAPTADVVVVSDNDYDDPDGIEEEQRSADDNTDVELFLEFVRCPTWSERLATHFYKQHIATVWGIWSQIGRGDKTALNLKPFGLLDDDNSPDHPKCYRVVRFNRAELRTCNACGQRKYCKYSFGDNPKLYIGSVCAEKIKALLYIRSFSNQMHANYDGKESLRAFRDDMNTFLDTIREDEQSISTDERNCV